MANVLTVVFDVESEAYQVFSELKSFKQDNDTQIAQIALVKNEDGKIAIKDSIDFDDTSRDYATVGGIIGGLLGILSGPIGVIIGYGIGSLAGAASGSMTDASDNSLIEEVTTKLLDGDVAVIALVHEEDESILNHAFAPYKTNIMRWDALALAREVELAGQVQDELYDKVQEDLDERRLNRLKEQGNDIADAIKATFRRLRGKE
ncbi:MULTISPECIES: DUF1269 domain-containing protein [Streptococcus]|uniref:DUF1269 domain-containing protein n=2 Tax=Streptococcus TaxID=1301 RepID=A0A081JFH2_STRMC|nr:MULTISPECIES: DUF1269 domain-containing protein [Streptococcus]ALT80249.1 hypothetical protein AU077_00955 [Streptococcus gallolyticus]KEH51585.1 membrane protein [Streptococcus macedonicus]MCW8485879.1 DUF1269 domain-containing protein [Streptococcus macedonicus]MCW8494542.1 DUF1269 domain-containing protein [Streptococcus macedonicus]MCW8499357.1 DUF1269 domain-containing protein [Streptococcus macedonicus]